MEGTTPAKSATELDREKLVSQLKYLVSGRWWCYHACRLLESVLLVMSMGVDVCMFNDELT